MTLSSQRPLAFERTIPRRHAVSERAGHYAPVHLRWSSPMCCTIEDFKTAFAEPASSGDLRCQDEQVAAELRTLKSLTASAVKAGVASDHDKGRLTELVQCYDAARKQNGHAPRETGDKFRRIYQEARNRISHFEQVLAAGTPPPARSSRPNTAPSTPTGPDTQPQQQPKHAYDFGLALLKPRLPRSSQGGSGQIAILELALVDIETRMEAAAARGDYSTALTLLRELEAKLAEYEAAQAERQRKRQEYDRRLPAVQPRADAVVRDSAAGKFPQLAAEQQEIVRLYDQMKQAAARGDYEQA
jgi:hypothetical protein